jgi:hypothetical protein
MSNLATGSQGPWRRGWSSRRCEITWTNIIKIKRTTSTYNITLPRTKRYVPLPPDAVTNGTHRRDHRHARSKLAGLCLVTPGIRDLSDLKESSVEAPLVFDCFPIFKIASKDAKVHCPAETRDTPMFILLRPASMIEAHASCVLSFRGQFAPDYCSDPIGVRVGNLKLEQRRWNITCHSGLPVELRAEVQAKGATFSGVSR